MDDSYVPADFRLTPEQEAAREKLRELTILMDRNRRKGIEPTDEQVKECSRLKVEGGLC